MGIYPRKMDIAPRKMDIAPRKMDITTRKMDIAPRKMDITTRKMDIPCVRENSKELLVKKISSLFGWFFAVLAATIVGFLNVIFILQKTNGKNSREVDDMRSRVGEDISAMCEEIEDLSVSTGETDPGGFYEPQL